MKKIISILLSIMAVMAASCSAEDPNAGNPQSGDASPLVIYATINGNAAASSRASLLKIHDLWSYVSFTSGDVMGFYSSGGNWAENNGKGNFDNLKLQYDAKNNQFNDLTNGVEFSPSNMSGSKIFMYFPYNAEMNDPGMELRSREVVTDEKYVVDDENTDSKNYNLRCVDFLSSDKIELDGIVDGQRVTLYGQFQHTFSELIIMRGEGFNNPPEGKERITAVIDRPYTHIKVEVVIDEDSWSCTPRLVYDDNNKFGLSEEEAERWNVWRGGNFGITDTNKEGYPAWYVIVPSLPGDNSIVEYIELYDNEGYLQRVSSLKLRDGDTKYVAPGWRYPMEVTMKELVPTVNPFRVVPWNGDVDLTDERERGINDITEFAHWVSDYNAYLKEPDDPDKINALLKYGDKIVDVDGKLTSWHFYVLSDLDMSNYRPVADEDSGDGDSSSTPTILPYIITQLSDVLDGTSTTLVNGKFINHTIKGLSKTFINSLSGSGSLQNFDFIEPDVRNPEDSDAAAGIIVNTMESGSIVNCNIDNGTLFNPGGAAGMVAGTMKGGMINKCTLSGFLIAKSTVNKIAGTTSGNASFDGNDADAIIYGEDKQEP